MIDKVKLGPKFPNPQAYKHAIARIVRQVALEHGWREAEVAYVSSFVLFFCFTSTSPFHLIMGCGF